MPDPIRLAKRVIELTGCSRADADRYIEGGWVQVDGEVVELPQFQVSTEQVVIDPTAVLSNTEPTTVLLHRGVGDSDSADAISISNHWTEDASGVRLLRRHLSHLSVSMDLEPQASGLLVLCQEGPTKRRLQENRNSIEQEYVVEVSGQITAYGLQRLSVGMRLSDRTLLPCKVSWQNEIRLRFAIKAVQPGQLQEMCAEVGLTTVAIRRIRIGKVPLAKMPVGQWRFLPAGETF
jgi:23S rRNA pseudouridine2604 synthase